MSDELTPRHSLESLKKEAKRWLDALRAGHAESRSRFVTFHPNAPASPTLRDVQFALAREHGFSGWPELKSRAGEAIGARARSVGHYEEKATALLEAYRTGTAEAMARHWALTWHRRSWSGMRAYVQLDLGRQAGTPGLDDDITLDDARWLVAREHGFERWDLLVASAGSVKPPHDLEPRTMTDALVEELCRRDPGTRHVDLGNSSITDRALEILATLPALESVSVACTRVSDAGVAHLGRCQHLREVNLQGTATGDGALRALAGKPALAQFRTGNNVTDAGLAMLREYPAFAQWQGGEATMGLTSYDAGPNHLLLRGDITDRGMTHLARLQGLYALDLDASDLAITAAGLRTIAGLPNLGWLACDATDESMPVIADMAKLRFLGCQDTVAGDAGFEALSRSHSIEYIWGRRCHNLRTRGFIALSRMPALRALSVSCLNVEDAGVASLPDFPALRELMPMDIPDEGYRHIGQCRLLDSLILMYCRETSDRATELIGGLQLRKYFASYTRITDRTPELLSRMTSLEEVTFDKCAGVTNAGISSLARLPRLRELRVSGQRITSGVVDGFGSDVQVHFSP